MSDHMDRISQLPDALLLQILSFVDAYGRVATSVLSKRWETLWMLVPKLEYDLSCADSDFVSSTLLLHRALVLESLSLNIRVRYDPLDIWIWVRTAVGYSVRELDIKYCAKEEPIRLPRSFYTCQTLVVLKLKNVSLVDFSSNSSSLCFRPLKILHLLSVRYSHEKSVETILSSCSSLEDLVVECCPKDNVFIFTIKVPTLQSLSLKRLSKCDVPKYCFGFVIGVPSLKYLNVKDYCGFCLAEDMPELVEANVIVFNEKIDNLFGSLTFVKRLSICSTKSNAPDPSDTTFHQLVHLELCTCKAEWWNLLVCLLKFSPNLRVLKLQRIHNVCSEEGCWNQPVSVPDCLLTSLEIFEWTRYEGKKDNSNFATYILRNSYRLKMAKICTESEDPKKNLEMIKKLAFSPRASSTCELAFN